MRSRSTRVGYLSDFIDDLVAKVDVPLDLLESLKPVLPPIDPQFPDIPDLPEPPYPGPDPGPLVAAKQLSVDELIEKYSTPSRSRRVKLSVEPHRLAFAEVQAIKAQPNMLAGASPRRNARQVRHQSVGPDRHRRGHNGQHLLRGANRPRPRRQPGEARGHLPRQEADRLLGRLLFRRQHRVRGVLGRLERHLRVGVPRHR